MAVACEEVFDECSNPSADEILDYATKIGIDPDAEPQLLNLAAEGLMKALPAGWRPCFDETTKSYYYFNQSTGKTQWEHPLDDLYRGLVKKHRTESQSLSLNEPTEDATEARDDIPSYEEALISNTPNSRRSNPLSPSSSSGRIKLAPLRSPSQDGSEILKPLTKQRSEDNILSSRKISLFTNSTTQSGVDPIIADFEKHPKILEKNTDLKVSGGGAMFLKANTKRLPPAADNPDAIQTTVTPPRSILRERSSLLESSKSLEFDKLSLDRSDKDDEDRKSVRFNLDSGSESPFFIPDRSSSEEDEFDENGNKIINITLFPVKEKRSRFTVSRVQESENNLKLVQPNPGDFVQPKLVVSCDGLDESEEDSKGNRTSDNSDVSPPNAIIKMKGKRYEERAEMKIAKIKHEIWEEKNEELIKFKKNLEESHQNELDRLLASAKAEHEERVRVELEELSLEMVGRRQKIVDEESTNLQKSINEAVMELKVKNETDMREFEEEYERKKEDLEKLYEDKLKDAETELLAKFEQTRHDLIASHNSELEELRQNQSSIVERIRNDFKSDEDGLREELSVERGRKDKNLIDGKQYEKLRCEKRLLEEKYKCLKEKYLRLKTEVKMTIEKRNKRKEQCTANTTTGSETERSNSNNKEKMCSSPLRKPPMPKHKVSAHETQIQTPTPKSSRSKVNVVSPMVIQDNVDTSISEQSDEPRLNSTNNYDSSDNNNNNNNNNNSANPGRSRKKIYSRSKSSSTSRINSGTNNNNNNGNNNKSSKRSQQQLQQRSCSPVESLRRQLQKLEDLEDEFPQNAQAPPTTDTYHLRYPFTGNEGKKFEGPSSELEFFRHRIHLERDSIKRAKEGLRSQKTAFQQRQNDLKLKNGAMTRQTLQQLCQEEKELTDMEVSLHRTRSLLGEKVIRLRHLEQSLQRATSVTADNLRNEDATLSDISSHSASSGISSTEFATNEALFLKGLMSQGDHLQESSEIIQSLENLNSEIREIWDVLRKQQSSSAGGLGNIYPDFGWPFLAAATGRPVVTAAAGAGGVGVPAAPVAPPSIPTLADRLHNYRQHVAAANSQSTVVTQLANQTSAATTTTATTNTNTLVERTRNLRHWLRQAGINNGQESGGQPPQATL